MNLHLKRLLMLTAVFAGVAVITLYLLPPAPVSTANAPIVHLGDHILVPRKPELCEKLIDPVKGAAVLHLQVDGLDTGVAGLACHDGTDPSITFELRRVRPDGVSPRVEEAAWNVILGDPLLTLGGTRTLHVDIARAGDAASAPLASAGAVLQLAIFRWWAPAAVVLMLFVWGLTIYLAAQSALIRDPAPVGTVLERRTFSLGRTQFAWWFAIIFASLVFLWLVTGEVPALSPQALALLGLSGVTTGLAAAVSPGRLASDGKEGVFLQDLLSDSEGVGIHRFQMVVITTALGLVFLYEVMTRLTMPTFDASLLTMMGLSAAAYVGLKVPEQSSPPAVADPKAGYAAAPTSALPPVIRPQ